jgi:amino acid transporter
MWDTILFAEGTYPGTDFTTAALFILVFMPISIIYLLFSVAMPRAGGEYVYASRILSPGWGFFAGWALLIANISSAFSISLPAIAYGLAQVFAVWGIETHNKSALNTGIMLASPGSIEVFVIMCAFWAVSFGLLTAFGMRTIKWVVWIATIGQWIALLVYILLASTTTLSTIKSNMQSMTGVSYNEVINAATKVGWSAGLNSTSATIYAGFTFVGLLVFGWTFVANVAGEIKQVRKAQILGQIVVLFLFTFFVVLFSVATYAGYTRDFVNALGFLASSGNTNLFGLPIGMSFAIAFSTTNPYLAIIPALGYVIASVGIAVAFAATATRNLFAYSFDGILPKVMSNVDRRGSPYVALIVALIPGFIFIYLGEFTSFLSLLAFLILVWFAGYMVTGAAATVFPWRRKDLFAAAPSITRSKIGKIPLISIFGAITVIESLFAIWAIVSPSLASNSFLSIQEIVYSTVIPLGLAWIIYGISKYYNKSRKIPFEMRFKELPPE